MIQNRQKIGRASAEAENGTRIGIVGRFAAVATRTEQRARKAAEAFGAGRWFADPFAMIRDEQVDLVTIAVRVPAHRELLLAALDAGKAVYCEAPLGRTVAEVDELPSISAAHTLDVIEAVLGEIIEVDARTDIPWPSIKLTDTGDESLRETPDHVDVLGKTRPGAVVTAHISGGLGPEDARFSFQIRGSEGWLRLSGGHAYGFQAGDLTLTSNVPFEAPEEATVSAGFMGAAINIGEVYALLVRDLHAGTHSTPGFEHLLHNGCLIEVVKRAAPRGERQQVC